MTVLTWSWSTSGPNHSTCQNKVYSTLQFKNLNAACHHVPCSAQLYCIAFYTLLKVTFGRFKCRVPPFSSTWYAKSPKRPQAYSAVILYWMQPLNSFGKRRRLGCYLERYGWPPTVSQFSCWRMSVFIRRSERFQRAISLILNGLLIGNCIL